MRRGHRKVCATTYNNLRTTGRRLRVNMSNVCTYNFFLNTLFLKNVQAFSTLTFSICIV